MAYSTSFFTSFITAKTCSRVVSIPWAVRPCSCTAATTSSSVPRVCHPHWQVTSFIVCFSSFLQQTQYEHITSIAKEVKSEHVLGSVSLFCTNLDGSTRSRKRSEKRFTP